MHQSNQARDWVRQPPSWAWVSGGRLGVAPSPPLSNALARVQAQGKARTTLCWRLLGVGACRTGAIVFSFQRALVSMMCSTRGCSRRFTRTPGDSTACATHTGRSTTARARACVVLSTTPGHLACTHSMVCGLPSDDPLVSHFNGVWPSQRWPTCEPFQQS
jgi:hypothetical protein